VAIIDQGIIISTGTPQALIENTEDARNLEEVFIKLTGSALRDYA